MLSRQQFQMLGPTQREAILRALNEDAEKLKQEYGEQDPAVRRLQEQMKQCNQIFKELSSKVGDRGVYGGLEPRAQK